MTAEPGVPVRPNSFVLCVGGANDVDLDEPARRELAREGMLLSTSLLEGRHLQVIDTGSDFAIYVGAELHASADYGRRVLERGWDHSRDNGALIHVGRRDQKVWIHSDFLGTESIYFMKLDSGLVISNRLENISGLVDTHPDPVGVYEYLLGAFSVGHRTPLADIRQSRPASSVSFSLATGSLQEFTGSSWHKVPRSEAPSRQRIASRWKVVLETMPQHTLMLSAGWDSRLILLGPNVSGTYTHGDLRSREVRLAFDLACQRSVPMTFVPLEASDYSFQRLSEMNDQLGHAFFPHWYHAAQVAAQAGSGPLAAGLFVEHFSGHYGINSLAGGWKKLKNLAKSMVVPGLFDRLSDAEAVSALVPILSSGFRKQPWFLGSDWLDFFGETQQAFEADVADALKGYCSDGTTGAQELCERFKLEHPGRQYFAKQTKCALPFSGYAHPYGDSELSHMVVRIPYRDRVNYKLSRAVVAATDQSLLQFPMAATLIKAKHPILLQEASRLVRIGWEQANLMTPRGSRLRLGWNNFQFLNRSQVFDAYVEALKHPIWDRERMHSFVGAYTRNDDNAFSLLDMFSKIVTVDHILTMAASGGSAQTSG